MPPAGQGNRGPKTRAQLQTPIKGASYSMLMISPWDDLLLKLCHWNDFPQKLFIIKMICGCVCSSQGITRFFLLLWWFKLKLLWLNNEKPHCFIFLELRDFVSFGVVINDRQLIYHRTSFKLTPTTSLWWQEQGVALPGETTISGFRLIDIHSHIHFGQLKEAN